MLNWHDFQLFNLPTCHPDVGITWFSTIVSFLLPSRCWTDMIFNHFFLPLPFRCWTNMIFNHLTFLLPSTCWTSHPRAGLSGGLMHSWISRNSSTSFLVYEMLMLSKPNTIATKITSYKSLLLSNEIKLLSIFSCKLMLYASF